MIIQLTITEKAVEVFSIIHLMTREILAVMISKEI